MSVWVYTLHIPILQNIQYSIFIFDIRFEKLYYHRHAPYTYIPKYSIFDIHIQYSFCRKGEKLNPTISPDRALPKNFFNYMERQGERLSMFTLSIDISLDPRWSWCFFGAIVNHVETCMTNPPEAPKYPARLAYIWPWASPPKNPKVLHRPPMSSLPLLASSGLQKWWKILDHSATTPYWPPVDSKNIRS